MEFFAQTTIEDLERTGRPTFNDGEHYLIVPHPNTMQTIVIDLGNGKHMTVCIMPKSDSVDVKLHGEHSYAKFDNGNGEEEKSLHVFFNLKKTDDG